MGIEDLRIVEGIYHLLINQSMLENTKFIAMYRSFSHVAFSISMSGDEASVRVPPRARWEALHLQHPRDSADL